MANIKSKLGKGARRYGDLLVGKTLKSKTNDVLDSARVVGNANRVVNELKGGVKSTKDFLTYKKADKVLGKYMDDFTAAQKGYMKEALKSTGARAATVGAAGAAYAGVNKASKSRKEKTAFDIIEEAFDKVAYDMYGDDLEKIAKKTRVKTKIEGESMGRKILRKTGLQRTRIGKSNVAEGSMKDNYVKRLKKLGVKNVKGGKSPLEIAMKNGQRNMMKAKVMGAAKSKYGKAGLAATGVAALSGAGYGAYKSLKDREKTASYIVEDSFDKVAGIKETLLKQSGKAKEMIGKHSGKAKEMIGQGTGKAKEMFGQGTGKVKDVMNSDKVKRYGDLLKGDTLKSKKKSVLGAASLTQKANKGYEETRKGVKSTADFIASQKAGKRVDRYGDHFLGAQKEYGKELLKSTGARAATVGVAGATGYGVAKASKKEDK